jgi:hypothetical protein
MPEDFSFTVSTRPEYRAAQRLSSKSGLVPSGLMCRTGTRSRSEVEES